MTIDIAVITYHQQVLLGMSIHFAYLQQWFKCNGEVFLNLPTIEYDEAADKQYYGQLAYLTGQLKGGVHREWLSTLHQVKDTLAGDKETGKQRLYSDQVFGNWYMKVDEATQAKLKAAFPALPVTHQLSPSSLWFAESAVNFLAQQITDFLANGSETFKTTPFASLSGKLDRCIKASPFTEDVFTVLAKRQFADERVAVDYDRACVWLKSVTELLESLVQPAELDLDPRDDQELRFKTRLFKQRLSVLLQVIQPWLDLISFQNDDALWTYDEKHFDRHAVIESELISLLAADALFTGVNTTPLVHIDVKNPPTEIDSVPFTFCGELLEGERHYKCFNEYVLPDFVLAYSFQPTVYSYVIARHVSSLNLQLPGFLEGGNSLSEQLASLLSVDGSERAISGKPLPAASGAGAAEGVELASAPDRKLFSESASLVLFALATRSVPEAFLIVTADHWHRFKQLILGSNPTEADLQKTLRQLIQSKGVPAELVQFLLQHPGEVGMEIMRVIAQGVEQDHQTVPVDLPLLEPVAAAAEEKSQGEALPVPFTWEQVMRFQLKDAQTLIETLRHHHTTSAIAEATLRDTEYFHGCIKSAKKVEASQEIKIKLFMLETSLYAQALKLNQMLQAHTVSQWHAVNGSEETSVTTSEPAFSDIHELTVTHFQSFVEHIKSRLLWLSCELIPHDGMAHDTEETEAADKRDFKLIYEIITQTLSPAGWLSCLMAMDDVLVSFAQEVVSAKEASVITSFSHFFLAVHFFYERNKVTELALQYQLISPSDPFKYVADLTAAKQISFLRARIIETHDNSRPFVKDILQQVLVYQTTNTEAKAQHFSELQAYFKVANHFPKSMFYVWKPNVFHPLPVIQNCYRLTAEKRALKLDAREEAVTDVDKLLLHHSQFNDDLMRFQRKQPWLLETVVPDTSIYHEIVKFDYHPAIAATHAMRVHGDHWGNTKWLVWLMSTAGIPDTLMADTLVLDWLSCRCEVQQRFSYTIIQLVIAYLASEHPTYLDQTFIAEPPLLTELFSRLPDLNDVNKLQKLRQAITQRSVLQFVPGGTIKINGTERFPSVQILICLIRQTTQSVLKQENGTVPDMHGCLALIYSLVLIMLRFLSTVEKGQASAQQVGADSDLAYDLMSLQLELLSCVSGFIVYLNKAQDTLWPEFSDAEVIQLAALSNQFVKHPSHVLDKKLIIKDSQALGAYKANKIQFIRSLHQAMLYNSTYLLSEKLLPFLGNVRFRQFKVGLDRLKGFAAVHISALEQILACAKLPVVPMVRVLPTYTELHSLLKHFYSANDKQKEPLVILPALQIKQMHFFNQKAYHQYTVLFKSLFGVDRQSFKDHPPAKMLSDFPQVFMLISILKTYLGRWNSRIAPSAESKIFRDDTREIQQFMAFVKSEISCLDRLNNQLFLQLPALDDNPVTRSTALYALFSLNQIERYDPDDVRLTLLLDYVNIEVPLEATDADESKQAELTMNLKQLVECVKSKLRTPSSEWHSSFMPYDKIESHGIQLGRIVQAVQRGMMAIMNNNHALYHSTGLSSEQLIHLLIKQQLFQIHLQTLLSSPFFHSALYLAKLTQYGVYHFYRFLETQSLIHTGEVLAVCASRYQESQAILVALQDFSVVNALPAWRTFQFSSCTLPHLSPRKHYSLLLSPTSLTEWPQIRRRICDARNAIGQFMVRAVGCVERYRKAIAALTTPSGEQEQFFEVQKQLAFVQRALNAAMTFCVSGESAHDGFTPKTLLQPLLDDRAVAAAAATGAAAGSAAAEPSTASKQYRHQRP